MNGVTDLESDRSRRRAVVGLERLALCALAGCAVAAAVSVFGFPAARGVEPPQALRVAGTALPFLAMILILAASRLRGTLLEAARRQARLAPVSLGSTSSAGSAASPELIAAYRRATRVDFTLLESVAWLGVAMVPLTGSIRYALVLIAAAVLGMLVRWPRLSTLDGLAR